MQESKTPALISDLAIVPERFFGGSHPNRNMGRFVGIVASLSEERPLLDVPNIASVGETNGSIAGITDCPGDNFPPSLGLIVTAGLTALGQRKGRYVGMVVEL